MSEEVESFSLRDQRKLRIPTPLKKDRRCYQRERVNAELKRANGAIQELRHGWK
jgi:hypothetical protein